MYSTRRVLAILMKVLLVFLRPFRRSCCGVFRQDLFDSSHILADHYS
jgi:hypothetical protein